MRVIFLDIDGVLNNPGCYRGLDGSKHSGSHTPAFQPSVMALNHITDQTGAVLIISSTWRFGGLEFCCEKLKEWGVTAPVIGMTAFDHQDYRGYEIGAWLTEHPEVESFVILDDDDDMAGLMERLVQTNGAIGLTMQDAKNAIVTLTFDRPRSV